MKTFQSALTNFMNDFASRDAVCHLADQGLTVTEICGKLQFPTKKELVTEMVWKHYLDTGRIRLEEPTDKPRRKVTYVREQGLYGRISMRQVVEEIPATGDAYAECHFGREIYKDKDGFFRRLEGLPEEDLEYVRDLPWPMEPVWHVKDERLERILQALDIKREKNAE